MISDSQLKNRALAAYFRQPHAGSLNQPGGVHLVEYAGMKYVVLTNTNDLLMVYRVRIVNGEPVLKGMKRWPAAVAALAGFPRAELLTEAEVADALTQIRAEPPSTERDRRVAQVAKFDKMALQFDEITDELRRLHGIPRT